MNHTPPPWPVADIAAFNWGRDLVQLNGGCLSLSDYLRAKACVDACEGMADPAKEIAELRRIASQKDA